MPIGGTAAASKLCPEHAMQPISRRTKLFIRRYLPELTARCSGLVLTCIALSLAIVIRRLVLVPPPHRPSVIEFVLAALAVACGSSGLALLVEGRGLFRPVTSSTPGELRRGRPR
ncbi:MAG: hypothetical protein JF593_04750 [Novosphingobium sp.]|nr:hypothetical protein [Novosphingobium sp.]